MNYILQIILLTILITIHVLGFSQDAKTKVTISEINEILNQSVFKSISSNFHISIKYSFKLNEDELIVTEVTMSTFESEITKKYIFPKKDIALNGILVRSSNNGSNIMYSIDNNIGENFINFNSTSSNSVAEGNGIALNIFLENISIDKLEEFNDLLRKLFKDIKGDPPPSETLLVQEYDEPNATNIVEEVDYSMPSHVIENPTTQPLDSEYILGRDEKIEYDGRWGETLMFIEEFDDNGNNWELTNEINSRATMDPGYLIIESKNEYSTNRIIPYKINTTGNFTIETKFMLLNGDEDSGQGIIWGYKDKTNYFNFRISSDGQYVITVYDKGSRKDLTNNWEDCVYIKKKYDWNKLKISKSGSKISFSINGHSVETFDFYSLGGNQIGFIVGQERKIKIDNLKVKQQMN